MAETLSKKAELAIALRRREREAKRRAELKQQRVKLERAALAIARQRKEQEAKRRAEAKERSAQLKRDQLIRSLLKRAIARALAGEARVELKPSEIDDLEVVQSSIGLLIREEPILSKQQKKLIQQLPTAVKALRLATGRASVAFANRRLKFARHVVERTPLKLVNETGRLERELSSLSAAVRSALRAAQEKYMQEISKIDDALRPLVDITSQRERLAGYLRVRELFRKKYLEGVATLEQAETGMQSVFVHDARTNAVALLPDTFVRRPQGNARGEHAVQVANRKALARSVLADLGISLYDDEVDKFLEMMRFVERVGIPGDEHELIEQQRELWSRREELSAKVERIQAAESTFKSAYWSTEQALGKVKSEVLADRRIRLRDKADLEATKWWMYFHPTRTSSRLIGANVHWVALVVWLASSEATRLLASVQRALLAAAEGGRRSARFTVESQKAGAKFLNAEGRQIGKAPLPPNFAVEIFRALDVECESRALASGAIAVTCRWAKRGRS